MLKQRPNVVVRISKLQYSPVEAPVSNLNLVFHSIPKGLVDANKANGFRYLSSRVKKA
jgi:hypothetical protein